KSLKKLKALKAEKSAAAKALKIAQENLQDKIDQIRTKLTEKQCESLVMALLQDGFFAELEKYLVAEVDKVVKDILRLWDKYTVSAEMLAESRNSAEVCLDKFLKELGYFE
ncbi:MAG: hypothetical protein FWG64_01645, partial [Firmicutes bacterium]|nr:hypothetical protein [Bacillota bacterium]